jgi:hypothetical protein
MKRLSIPMTAALLCLAATAGAQTITRGPFLQQLGTDRIVVVWETDSDTDGRVEYGLTAGLGDTVSDSNRSHHEVALEGLQPATTYHYKVVSGGTESPLGVFSTAPPAPEPFRFVVFGDNRDEDGDHFNHEALMPAILAEAPDFVINTGDMVDVGLSGDMWDRFFEIERELLRNVPLWPTFGNHEQWDFANLTYLKIFALPPHSSGEERYYEFRHSNCHFIVTNTHDILYGTYYSVAQKNFIEAALTAAAADPQVDHIFVVGHHGPYSSSNHGGSPTVRNFIEGLAQMDRIDYFFAGHDHNYERWEGDTGLKGFVTGGGGAGLYSQDDPNASYTRHFCQCYNYLLVEVNGGWLRICPRYQDGTAIEPCLETGQVEEPGVDAGIPDGGDGGDAPQDGTAQDADGGGGDPGDAGADDRDAGGDDASGDDGSIPGDDGNDNGDDAGQQPDAVADAGGDDASVGPDEGQPADDDGGDAGCGCGTGSRFSLGCLVMLIFARRRLTSF